MRVFRERWSIFVCASFPFGFKGGMWNLIVLVPDKYHSLFSTYLFILNSITCSLVQHLRKKGRIDHNCSSS